MMKIAGFIVLGVLIAGVVIYCIGIRPGNKKHDAPQAAISSSGGITVSTPSGKVLIARFRSFVFSVHFPCHSLLNRVDEH